MEMIVAVDKNWAIGKNGGMLVSIPADLKTFRDMTLGHVVVMGRKTLESLPGQRPLELRKNIVFTRNPDYKPKGVTVVHNMQELEKESISKVSLIAFTQNDIGNAFWNEIGWTKREDLNYYDFTLNKENIINYIK